MAILGTHYVGFDIGRYGVGGVKVKKNGKKTDVVSQTYIPYEIRAFDGETLVDEGELVVAMSKVGEILKINVEDFIVSALFPDRILFRQIKLPNMARQQVINAAKFQIVKELSISPEEITVEVDTNAAAEDDMLSVFVVRNEDINRFNSLFVKAALPLPDIVDAGYLKFNYLLEEKFPAGVSFVAFEDGASTYLELFKNGKLIAIDSIAGGADDIFDADEISVGLHYSQTNEELQRLLKMMMSRHSMSNEDVKTFICVSEMKKYNEFWFESAKDFNLAEETIEYGAGFGIDPVFPMGAYNLAIRGVFRDAKIEFLQKKAAKNKTP